MGCEKCNIKLRPGEECLYCWKVKKERTEIIPTYRYVMNWDEPIVTNHMFTAGSTMTVDWSTWSDDTDWHITVGGHTR
jgi:hypothetical protein